MIMDWKALAEQCDAIVDNTFGTLITLVPWVVSDFAIGSADEIRLPIEDVVAIEVSRPAMPEGSHKVVEADRYLSIRKEQIEEIKLQSGDRVLFQDTGVVMEVTYISPDATDRPIVHLIRINT